MTSTHGARDPTPNIQSRSGNQELLAVLSQPSRGAAAARPSLPGLRVLVHRRHGRFLALGDAPAAATQVIDGQPVLLQELVNFRDRTADFGLSSLLKLSLKFRLLCQ